MQRAMELVKSTQNDTMTFKVFGNAKWYLRCLDRAPWDITGYFRDMGPRLTDANTMFDKECTNSTPNIHYIAPLLFDVHLARASGQSRSDVPRAKPGQRGVSSASALARNEGGAPKNSTPLRSVPSQNSASNPPPGAFPRAKRIPARAKRLQRAPNVAQRAPNVAQRHTKRR